MARLKINYEGELKELIKSVADIQDEGCQDFKNCYSFAVSNFKYHRFLSVDSHKVNRSINGLSEKFAIHSQVKKAKDLKELTEQFLRLPLFEHQNFGHTDSHYAILSLLIDVAQNPTIKDDFESKTVKVLEEEEGFDWQSYLMEGMDVYRGGPYPDSPIWSEDDESETEEQERSETLVSEKLDDSKASSVDSGSPHPEVPPVISDPQGAESTEPRGYVWLAQNIITPYWNGAIQKIPESQEYYNVVKDWDCYEAQITPLLRSAPRTVVTEAQVLRETLWMLQGISELFVYERAGIVYHLRDNVCLTHLTQAALKESLLEFMTAGAQIWELESFIESMITPDLNPAEGEDPDEPGVSLTFQAFAYSVSCFIHEYKAILCDLEKDLQEQERTHTIALLKPQLQPWLQKLFLVHRVYMNGVYKYLTLKSNNEKAALLLSCLADTVMQLDTLSEKELLCVLVPIWIETCRPYIDIIDDWITNGCLVDARHEFIIQRNKTELVPDETFWKHSLMVKFSESQRSKSNAEEELDSSGEIKSDEPAQTDAFNADTAYSTLECTPHFLHAIIEPIIQAGKTMDVFNTLNCLHKVLASRNRIERERRSLYEMFLDSLSQFQEDLVPEVSVDQSQRLSNLTPVSKDPIYRMLLDQPDPLLQINMDNLFVTPAPRKNWQDIHNVRKIVADYLDSWQFIQPLDNLFENCLYPHITHKSTWVCRKLVNTLITEHHLLDHLQAMRNFFLMEAGSTMFEFYTNIFSRLRFDISPLKNLSILNQALTQAVEENFPEEIDKLRIYVKHVPGLLDNTSQSFQLNDTDCIKLSYAIAWPVDIVLDSKSVKKYNQIFNMLLHIKRAKYCLDQLRFTELDKPLLKDQEWKVEEVPRKQKIHRLHILRWRLMSFVYTFNSHIMTQMHSGGDLMLQVLSAADLDEVITCHDRYLDGLLEQCFLGKKNSALRDSLSQVLNITLQLNTHWNRGVDNISVETLSQMEGHFTKWIPFLQWCFGSKKAAGHNPHLAELISSLELSNDLSKNYQMI